MGARGTVGLARLALVLALAVSPPGAAAAGEREGADRMLPGCGICYPGGYDVNTVGDVQGAISDLQVPADGPVRFVVAGEREQWVVIASPAWFWEKAAQRLEPGDSVSVRGSKTLGADGTLYLVAREIRSPASGGVVVLRDRRGTPLWSSRHRGFRVPDSGAGDCRSQGRSHGRR